MINVYPVRPILIKREGKKKITFPQKRFPQPADSLPYQDGRQDTKVQSLPRVALHLLLDRIRFLKTLFQIYLDDFLLQANMAGKQFASEKEQFVVLDPTTVQIKTVVEQPSSRTSITWADEQEEIKKEQERQRYEKSKFMFQIFPRHKSCNKLILNWTPDVGCRFSYSNCTECSRNVCQVPQLEQCTPQFDYEISAGTVNFISIR